MSLKRKAEDDYSLPPKRTLLEPNAPQGAVGYHGALVQSPKRSMDVDSALADVSDRQQQQSEQQRVPLSTCTDLVVYKPPVLGDLARAPAAPSIPPIVLGNGHTLDLQQPNAMALVLRSLTPEQRAALRGMWDVLRDQKVLQGMLRQLPSHAQHDDPHPAAVALTGISPSGCDTQQPATHCTIEELDTEPEDHDAPAAPIATAAPAAPTSGQMIFSPLPVPMQHRTHVGGSFAPATPSIQAQQSAAAAAATPYGVWQQDTQQQRYAWPCPQHVWPLQQQQQQQVVNGDTLMLPGSDMGQQQQQHPVAVVDHAAPMEMDM